MTLRARILAEVPRWIPSDLGDGVFEQLLGPPTGKPGEYAYYRVGDGSPCGVIVAAILELSGAPASLVNRGPTFQPGAHISRMIAAAKKLGAWRTDLAGLRPGDIYVLSVPPTYTDTHTGVFLEALPGGWIKTADAGQRGKNNQPAARICERRINGLGEVSYPGGVSGFRPFHGRVAVDELPDAATIAPTGSSSAAPIAGVALLAAALALAADT